MTKVCSIEGCGKPYLARGYCSKHYNRLLRHGDPLYRSRAYPGEHLDWLAANSNHDGGGCLIWPFKSRNLLGYGVTSYGGVAKNASNVMCEMAHGDPPTPLHEAAHSCGNGHEGCVHPKHLRWATRQENHADKIGHGTHLCGEKLHHSILKACDVLAIRASKKSPKEISEQYGITANYVYQLRSRARWKHLP